MKAVSRERIQTYRDVLIYAFEKAILDYWNFRDPEYLRIAANVRSLYADHGERKHMRDTNTDKRVRKIVETCSTFTDEQFAEDVHVRNLIDRYENWNRGPVPTITGGNGNG